MASKKYNRRPGRARSVSVCDECGGEGIIRHEPDAESDVYLYCSCVAGQALQEQDRAREARDFFRPPEEPLY